MDISERKKKIVTFYRDLREQHGDYSPASVGWISKETQQKKFVSLLGLGSFAGKSVLDLGCGFGDFYGFLQEMYPDVEYVGIGICESFYYCSTEKYPTGTFYVQDMLTFVPDRKYDYIVANGSFSANLGDRYVYFDLIKRMFGYANIGRGWIMLKAGEHEADEIFLSRNPKEVSEFCLSLTPHEGMYDDYLSYDFSVFLYHQEGL